ncbi:nitronate monooxygenase family protein [Pelomonas sp. Root1237]|uniref:NAD(P)H-dependent flavin oxidoreductase n=1 Tax=Pelomonas sp. Root1237 TaxID=1736434 RepID=UPI0006F6A62B|nr:nitronate monooxygenase family protein [Pelomonas sp. Root1237]KQV89076.1 2-nitropropane dioxygenase [Pelomonas sp. Root1237]
MTTPSLLDRMAMASLKPLLIRGRQLLPIVQGGMGVGISAHRLAGSVAAQGAWGTIASVDLRRHHPDLMARSEGMRDSDENKKTVIQQANQEALAREIRLARGIAGGRGLLAVNVMRAVSDYAASVRTALQEGVDALVVGAGLPLDLPELAQDHPNTALVPILSDARGVALLWRKWERRQRIPSAIIIEHPGHAAGHLGAARVADLSDARFDFETVLPAVRQLIRDAGVEGQVPLIAAGGVRCCEDIQRLQSLGADAAQLGTAFVATEECDAHPNFKQVLVEARDEDLVEFTSVAGLPARAVMTPWLRKYLKAEERLQAVAQLKQRCTMAFDCLSQCGLRDGLKGWGQFCIDQRLGSALRGEVNKGLFFRGRGGLPFGSQITSVRQLLERLLTPGIAVGTPV